MTFDEVLEQVITLLKRQGRVSYRALKRRLDLDDEYIEDLKAELIQAQRLALDEDGAVLVWTGGTEGIPEPASQPVQTTQQPTIQQDQTTQVEPPPPGPPTPDAERRQLTVMFSDLVDSTKLSGQLDPEDYREVVRAYQSTCAEVIYRYSGYVAQHLGDALLVYFGYPQAHEDDAQRAVRTGLGMLEAMKTLNERLERDKGIRLSIRVGIHTGLTVIGDVGSGQKHEMLALGEAPNVASRIQGLAEPDSIAISEATYRLVEGYFDCDDLGSHTLKGVTEPVQVYRVIGESDTQSRLEIAATRGLTPLVGRESEVTLLLERWNQVKDGQGQAVLLSGEGGIGKSRLVQVLKEHVASEPHTRWECRSSPYFTNTALYPITDILQRTLQFQADDTPEQRLEKLERELSQYHLSLEESVLLFAPLLSIPTPEDRYPALNWTPQRQRQKTLESIVSILLEQAEHQPVFFIMEDLHWTDPSTLELLDLLMDQTPTASIMTLLTCRPAFQPSWHHRSYLTEMTLNRLSRSQIEQMAEEVGGGKNLPAEVLQQIVERTDGVPLFVEEMTKAVLESGYLKETNGRYELVGSLTSLTIPATLQDSLMARLDRLVSAKGIAQLGATIGRTFSYELLHAVASVDEAILQHELGRLVEAELIYQRGLPPQVTYMFKHALIRDAAYQSLLKSTRQQYHQRIALTLEERFPETAEHQPELLAHHLTEAGLNEQAVSYWQRAGERTSDRSAYMEAIAHLTKGLEVVKSFSDTHERAQHELQLQLALGDALVATKGYAASEVEQAYTRAWTLCQRLPDPPQGFSALLGLWRFYNMRAELQTDRQLAEQLLTLAQRQHNPLYLMQAHFALGETLFRLGNLVSGHAHLGQSLDLLPRQSPDDWADVVGTRIACLVYMAWILWHRGYATQALHRIHEALTLVQELKHPFTLAFTQAQVIIFHQFRRDQPATQSGAEALITLSVEHDFPFWLTYGRMLRGWAIALRGHPGEGITQIHEGLDVWRCTGAELEGPYFLVLLAEAYGVVGQSDEGLTALTEALALVDKSGERWCEAELHRLKGELLLSQSPDSAADAESCFHQALSVSRNQQAKSWELRSAISLSRLWQQQGKRAEAQQLLGDVYGWFTEGFDTLDLKDAKALLDDLEGRHS